MMIFDKRLTNHWEKFLKENHNFVYSDNQKIIWNIVWTLIMLQMTSSWEWLILNGIVSKWIDTGGVLQLYFNIKSSLDHIHSTWLEPVFSYNKTDPLHCSKLCKTYLKKDQSSCNAVKFVIAADRWKFTLVTSGLRSCI